MVLVPIDHDPRSGLVHEESTIQSPTSPRIACLGLSIKPLQATIQSLALSGIALVLRQTNPNDKVHFLASGNSTVELPVALLLRALFLLAHHVSFVPDRLRKLT